MVESNVDISDGAVAAAVAAVAIVVDVAIAVTLAAFVVHRVAVVVVYRHVIAVAFGPHRPSDNLIAPMTCEKIQVLIKSNQIRMMVT